MMGAVIKEQRPMKRTPAAAEFCGFEVTRRPDENSAHV
jgi:hypothetical protein